MSRRLFVTPLATFLIIFLGVITAQAVGAMQCAIGVTVPPAYAGPGPCACPAGRYRESMSAVNCTACVADTIMPFPNTLVVGTRGDDGRFYSTSPCVWCEEISRLATTLGMTGQSECLRHILCGPGQFATVVEYAGDPDENGNPTSGWNDACINCPSGTARAGYSHRTQCDACEVSTSPGTAVCPCPSGKYKPEFALANLATNPPYNVNLLTTCSACPANTAKFGTNTKTCAACPAGTTIAAGSAVCPCPAGQVRATSDAVNCTRCAIDTFIETQNMLVGLSSCWNCPTDATTTMTPPALVQCARNIKCAPGTFATYYPNHTRYCAPCPMGTAKTGINSRMQCDPCELVDTPPGTAVCPCPPGKSKPDFSRSDRGADPAYSTNAVLCSACPANTTQQAVGNYPCVACPAGTTTLPGYSGICPCPSGTIRDYVDSPGCTPCPVDTYMTLQNTLARYQLFTGDTMAICTPCPYGTSTHGKIGQAACTLRDPRPDGGLGCAPGEYYIPGTKSVSAQCQLCAEGTSQPFVPGQAVFAQSCQAICTSRPYIHTGLGAANNRCPCAAGSFYAITSDTCQPCPENTYMPTQGEQTSCLACSVGRTTFSLTGMVQCLLDVLQLKVVSASNPPPCPSGRYALQSVPPTLEQQFDGRLTGPSGSSIMREDTAFVSGSAASSSSTAVVRFYPDGAPTGDANSQLASYLSKQNGVDVLNPYVTCVACPPFTASASSGALSCMRCDVYTPAGSVSCPCAPGTYKSHITDSCINCPINTYLPFINRNSSCIPCPSGTRAYRQGSTHCVDICRANWRYDELHARCEPCPIGTGSLPDSTSCFTCPLGTGSNGTGMPCLPCAAGKVTNMFGICAPCSAGTEVVDVYCRNCPPGRTSVTQGACIIYCGIGTYSNDLTGNLCIPCPSGYTSVQGSGSCMRCSEGQYLAAGGMCANCPFGMYSDTPGVRTQCKACPAGTLSDIDVILLRDPSRRIETSNTGGTRCVCQPGAYNTGNATCAACDAGRFSADYGVASCTSCTVGTWSSRPGSTTCAVCAPGKYRDALTIECAGCDAGKYSNGPGMSSCTSCPANTFADHASTATACLFCPFGTRSNTSAVTCTPCSPGTYASTATNGVCTPCPTGTFTSVSAKTTCSACAPGYYAPTVGTSSCAACPAGRVTFTSGASACAVCPSGQYSATPASSSCIGCSSGRTSNGNATVPATACIQCPIGKFSVGGGPCTSCQPGRTTATTGSEYCIDCAFGKSSNGNGGACYNCRAGTWSLPGGSCVPCNVGTVTDGSGGPCIACTVGTYSPASRDACLLCPAGKISTAMGSTSCGDCPTGMSSFPGSDHCSACAPWQYSRAGSACTICPAGQESVLGNGGACTNCQTGFVSDGFGGPCLPCPSCTSAERGAATCSACPLGYETYFPGGPCVRCVDDLCVTGVCGIGIDNCYNAGSACGFAPSFATPCSYDGVTWRSCSGSNGKTCTNSRNATLAPSGYVCGCDPSSSNGTYPDCIPVPLPCGIGYYSATGETPCAPCPYGQATTGTSSTSVASCVCLAGTYLHINATDLSDQRCLACPQGTISVNNGATACTACNSASATTMGAGATVCVCKPGFYSATGFAPCTAAASGKFVAHLAATTFSTCPVGYTNPAVLDANYTARVSCTQCAAGYAEMRVDNATATAFVCDRNECLEYVGGNGDCDARTHCVNTLGGFTCTACPPLFERIDNACVCPPGYVLTNASTVCSPCTNGTYSTTPNSLSCSACPTGFRGNATDGTEGSTGCVDIDECADGRNGGCSLTPFSVAECFNFPGYRACGSCAPGFIGTGYGDCISECTLTPNGGCDPLTTCDSQGGGTFCTECPYELGYSGNGFFGCTPINLCANSVTGCDPLSTCNMTGPGTFECLPCPYPYVGDGRLGNCTYSPCSFDNGGCDPLAACTLSVDPVSLIEVVTCGSCPSGYYGSGNTTCTAGFCVKIPNGGCDPLSECINSPLDPANNATCGSCPPGYTGNGTIGCVDVDECADGNNGGCGGAACYNLLGSRACDTTCPYGYARQSYYSAENDGAASLWRISASAVIGGGGSSAHTATMIAPILVDGITPVAIGAFAMERSTLTLWAATSALSGMSYECMLIKVNTSTGVGTVVGSLGDVELVDMSYDDVTCTLWGTGHQKGYFFTPTSVYSIDKDTGLATPQFTLDFSDDLGSPMAFVQEFDSGTPSSMSSSSYVQAQYAVFGTPPSYSDVGLGIEKILVYPPYSDVTTQTLIPQDGLFNVRDNSFRITAWSAHAADGSDKLVGLLMYRYSGDVVFITIGLSDGAMTIEGPLPQSLSAIAVDGMCTDVNECEDGNNGGCSTTPGSFSNCTNTPGSRICAPCAPGFTGTGEGPCVDINECATIDPGMENGGCDPLTTCINTPGSRLCGPCPYGYFGNGVAGCVEGSCAMIANGGCDPLAVCFAVNATEPAQCEQCPTGYGLAAGNGSSNTPMHQTCLDIDECTVDPVRHGGCGVGVTCNNFAGGRECSACLPGFARRMYIVQFPMDGGASLLYHLDLNANTTTLLGPIQVPAANPNASATPLYVSSFAADPMTGLLYAIAVIDGDGTNSSNYRVVRVNNTNGAAQVLGYPDIAMDDVTFSSSGVMIGMARIDSQLSETGSFAGLHQISLLNGHVTYIDGTWHSTDGGNALSFLPLSSIIDSTRLRMWTVQGGGPMAPALHEIDQKTGRLLEGSRRTLQPARFFSFISRMTVDDEQRRLLAPMVDMLSPVAASKLISINPDTATYDVIAPLPDGTFSIALDSVCRDIDECIVDNGGCGPLYSCINTPGSVQCRYRCRTTGFTASSVSEPCSDINECRFSEAAQSLCQSVDGICSNVDGTFVCVGETSYPGALNETSPPRRRLMSDPPPNVLVDQSLTWPTSVCANGTENDIPCTPAAPLYICMTGWCSPADHPGQIIAFLDPCANATACQTDAMCITAQSFVDGGGQWSTTLVNDTLKSTNLALAAVCIIISPDDDTVIFAGCAYGFDPARNCTSFAAQSPPLAPPSSSSSSSSTGGDGFASSTGSADSTGGFASSTGSISSTGDFASSTGSTSSTGDFASSTGSTSSTGDFASSTGSTDLTSSTGGSDSSTGSTGSTSSTGGSDSSTGSTDSTSSTGGTASSTGSAGSNSSTGDFASSTGSADSISSTGDFASSTGSSSSTGGIASSTGSTSSTGDSDSSTGSTSSTSSTGDFASSTGSAGSISSTGDFASSTGSTSSTGGIASSTGSTSSTSSTGDFASSTGSAGSISSTGDFASSTGSTSSTGGIASSTGSTSSTGGSDSSTGSAGSISSTGDFASSTGSAGSNSSTGDFASSTGSVGSTSSTGGTASSTGSGGSTSSTGGIASSTGSTSSTGGLASSTGPVGLTGGIASSTGSTSSTGTGSVGSTSSTGPGGSTGSTGGFVSSTGSTTSSTGSASSTSSSGSAVIIGVPDASSTRSLTTAITVIASIIGLMILCTLAFWVCRPRQNAYERLVDVQSNDLLQDMDQEPTYAAESQPLIASRRRN